jgi:hypothetical protein
LILSANWSAWRVPERHVRGFAWILPHIEAFLTSDRRDGACGCRIQWMLACRTW